MIPAPIIPVIDRQRVVFVRDDTQGVMYVLWIGDRRTWRGWHPVSGMLPSEVR